MGSILFPHSSTLHQWSLTAKFSSCLRSMTGCILSHPSSTLHQWSITASSFLAYPQWLGAYCMTLSVPLLRNFWRLTLVGLTLIQRKYTYSNPVYPYFSTHWRLLLVWFTLNDGSLTASLILYPVKVVTNSCFSSGLPWMPGCILPHPSGTLHQQWLTSVSPLVYPYWWATYCLTLPVPFISDH